MFKQLRNWQDRYRPLKDDHFLVKSILNTEYTRVDNASDIFDRYPKKLGENLRLGGVFANMIDPNMKLYVILRVYYWGDPRRAYCQYKIIWTFGTESVFDELYSVKYESGLFGCDVNHVNEEFESMRGSIISTIFLHRLKSHADLTVPVEPSTESDDILHQRWERWQLGMHNR